MATKDAKREKTFLVQEAERQRLFSAREAEKERAFERDVTSYKENSEHLRALNRFLWQVPLIAMTLTGGLWYGIAQGMVGDIRKPLLAFACLANVGLIIIMVRVRFVFDRILKVTRAFNPEATADTHSDNLFLRERVVMVVFCTLMGFAAVISLVGAIAPDKLFDSVAAKTKSMDNRALRDRLIQQQREK